ncbi:hypothetical protein Tco_1503920 [Tanacetum coccineum]
MGYLTKLVKNISVAAMDLDSPKEDQSIQILSEYESGIQVEVQTKIEDALVLKPPPSPISIKIQELTNQIMIFSASIPTELKELSSKVNEINRAMGDLKQYIKKLEIEVPGDLKALLDKMEEFQTSISALTNKVASLEDFMLELLGGLLALPGKGEKYQMIEEEIKNQKGIEQAVKADVARSEIKKDCKYGARYGLGVKAWSKVIDACPKRTRACWTTIYTQIRQKLNALHKNEQELELDHSKPLKEQDPIIKLNLLAKKKRKHVGDLRGYFKSTKRQAFINIEDFEEINNDMLYHVQDIFFIFHQGTVMDDLAKTFSSFLVAEVDKRNLNPLKQMRLNEQLRQ